eukprot:CAMPEP_0172756810 /NCGR_PEP_ID=MMETSP1074-20121228/162490_1 /TAXON_ID=2916 /ORGANISM="Ceratium fusus, Strain PA161109" /LENGTH=57 /DNA_ID=CAMNT_0013590119 /DNA_START=245 /DNA_END=418 /DNA_ORIENTATION=+
MSMATSDSTCEAGELSSNVAAWAPMQLCTLEGTDGEHVPRLLAHKGSPAAGRSRWQF